MFKTPHSAGPRVSTSTISVQAWRVSVRPWIGTSLSPFLEPPLSLWRRTWWGCVSPGPDYVSLPDTLYSDFQAVDTLSVPARRTRLIVLTPSIKAGLINPIANIGINWWNQFEDQFSTTAQFSCWAEVELESISPGF